MASKTRLIHDDYTVAWICALPLEMAAAKVMLDETHDSLPQPSTGHNTYTLGRRAGHNVIVACLPSGVYGTTSAATVLSHMLPTFPCLRFGLMVGIGGGVPQKDVDIRLGDVVVSLPSETSGGVIQYDFGKSLRDGQFQRIGSLNKPPRYLLTAISQMRSDHMIGKRPITSILSETVREHQEMKEHFSRPANDWLFKPTYAHESSPDCSQCDQIQLIQRHPRLSEDPSIHYGLIASGNQMEAAGLMDQLPCLVIRGICDYCDSHKNNNWQRYAALAAAAYVKAFLELVPIHGKQPEPRPSRTASHWMVPFYRNMRFVGREEEIDRIEELLNTSPAKIAVCGLGGVGKTQIALEVAHRMRERDFDSIFWIPCTSHESIEQASKVKAHLSQSRAGKWLLIFDNADDMSMWSRGHILLTTRNRKVAVLLASANVFHIAEPDPKAAMRIMEMSLVDKAIHSGGNQAIALQLLENLAFFSLAISQATAYINKNSIGISDYMDLLQNQEAEVIDLLSEDFGDNWRYQDIQNPVAKTWLISFQQIQHLNQVAADYLQFMACINPRDIPKSLLPEATSKKMMDAIGLLKAFSFVLEQAGSLSLHRLVHLSTRNWLRMQGHFDQQICSSASHFDEVFPDDTYTDRKLWQEYLPHDDLALVYFDLNRYSDAEEMQLQHPDTSGAMNNLAITHSGCGKLKEAEELRVQLYNLDRRMLGPEHLYTLSSACNLAAIYRKLKKLEQAEELALHALEARKRLLEAEHPDILLSTDILASIYQTQGRLQEAEQLQVAILETHEKVLGREHPRSLVAMRRAQDAIPLFETCLNIMNKVLGPEHPSTLITMHSLACTWQRLGRMDLAFTLFETGLHIRNKVLGPEHQEP
ncbi:hypothetical protein BDW74DRAFT_186277 [Aspergillus multicolor]|uniref:uncharacterized protein n=1 Tax=Aspergillus multicolor TaxID=41759 RepID=UPI003CCE13BC